MALYRVLVRTSLRLTQGIDIYYAEEDSVKAAKDTVLTYLGTMGRYPDSKLVSAFPQHAPLLSIYTKLPRTGDDGFPPKDNRGKVEEIQPKLQMNGIITVEELEEVKRLRALREGAKL